MNTVMMNLACPFSLYTARNC